MFRSSSPARSASSPFTSDRTRRRLTNKRCSISPSPGHAMSVNLGSMHLTEGARDGVLRDANGRFLDFQWPVGSTLIGRAGSIAANEGSLLSAVGGLVDYTSQFPASGRLRDGTARLVVVHHRFRGAARRGQRQGSHTLRPFALLHAQQVLRQPTAPHRRGAGTALALGSCGAVCASRPT